MARPRGFPRQAPSRLQFVARFAWKFLTYFFALPTLVFLYFATSFLLTVFIFPLGAAVWYTYPEHRADFKETFWYYFENYFGSTANTPDTAKVAKAPRVRQNLENQPRNPYKAPTPDIYLNNRRVSTDVRAAAPKGHSSRFEIYVDESAQQDFTRPPSRAHEAGRTKENTAGPIARDDNPRHREDKVLSDGLPYDLRNIPISPHWAIKTPGSQLSQASSLNASRLNSTTSSPFSRKSTIRYPTPASVFSMTSTPGTVVRKVKVPEPGENSSVMMPLGELPVDYNASLGSKRTQTILKSGRQVRYDMLKLTEIEEMENMRSGYPASTSSTNESGTPSKKVRFMDSKENNAEAEALADLAETMQIETETESILSAMDSESDEGAFSSPDTKSVLRRILGGDNKSTFNLLSPERPSSHSKKTIGPAGGKALLQKASSIKSSQQSSPMQIQSSPLQMHSSPTRHLHGLSPASPQFNSLSGLGTSFSSPTGIPKLKLRAQPSKSSLRNVSMESTASSLTIVAASEASID